MNNVITKVVIPEANFAAFADWQADLHAYLIDCSGFKSLEINSSSSSWTITQNFYDAASLQNWLQSERRKLLISEVKSLSTDFSEAQSNHLDDPQGVTEVFLTTINPQRSEEYRHWIARIHQAEAKFPGFIGLHVQSPTGQQKNWVTLLQFDTLSNLENWLESGQRKQLLDESKELITKLESHRMISPYEGWFSQKENKPSLWKQTMIILLVLFPIVVLEMRFLFPWLTDLNPVLATFIGNAISVSLVSWPLMPLAIFFLGWWLASSNWKMGLHGTLIMIGLYILEIALLWNLL